MIARYNLHHRRTGTAALELVIVLPILLAIVAGAADGSRVLNYDNVLTNAARVGAAYGATHQVTDYTYDNWEQRVIDQVSQEAVHLRDFDRDSLDIVVTTFDEADGSTRVQVDVSYPFEMIINWPGWPKQIVLQRSISMRGYR